MNFPHHRHRTATAVRHQFINLGYLGGYRKSLLADPLPCHLLLRPNGTPVLLRCSPCLLDCLTTRRREDARPTRPAKQPPGRAVAITPALSLGEPDRDIHENELGIHIVAQQLAKATEHLRFEATGAVDSHTEPATLAAVHPDEITSSHVQHALA